MCLEGGWGGGVMTFLLFANNDDVLRWVMNVFGRGVGWGGNDFFCYLQTKMMLFGG